MDPRGNLYLIGMMGCGKSTVGRLLAPRLGMDFVDLDSELEAASGLSVAEIFRRAGAAEFREREARALWQHSARADQVIALGGGALMRRGSLERARSTGRLVWLQASSEELARRLGDAAERPLLAGLSALDRIERLRQLLAERAAAYGAAELAVETDGRAVSEVADDIARWWCGLGT